MKALWKQLYSKDGILVYEGFTVNGKAYGVGTSYYENGSPFHEGIFGVKGLLNGREYYPNGQVRFDGVFRLTKGYGPNAPEYGTWYSENGEELFRGKFEIKRGGVGYPMVVCPEGYGTASFHTNLGEYLFMWEDEKNLKDDLNKESVLGGNKDEDI